MSFPADSKSEGAALPTHNPTPTFLPDLLDQHEEDRRKRCRRKRRFFHLTALSLVALWFFTRDSPSESFMGLVGGGHDHDHDHHHHHDHDHDHDRHPHPPPHYPHPHPPPHPPPPPHSHPPPHYPIPHDVELHECVSWEESKGDFPHYATGNLTLDSASDLFFVSRGSLSFGDFELEQSEGDSGGKVDVQVSAGYSHSQFLDITKVCKITKGDSEGVGIFTPEWKHHRGCRGDRGPVRQPKFSVRVALPAAKKDEVLSVKSLITDLPLFKQSVTDLGETVYFEKLRLTSINEDIEVESATGEDIVVATVNAPISGSFKTDKLLVLETVNAPISAEATLNHKGDSAQIVSSVFKSASGNIEVTEKFEASGKKEDAKFSTLVKAVRGNVEIEVEESPLGALAVVQAETTTGNVNVKMPSTFEGKFKLETLVGRETVNAPDVEDPAGRGRKREVKVEHPRWTTVEGSVSWSEEKNDGTVLLKSTTGSLTLDL